MQRLALVILIGLAFVLAGFAGVEEVDAADPEAADATAAEEKVLDAQSKALKKGRRGKGPKGAGGANKTDAIWWDDPRVIKAITLTDEQREKMGEFLESYHKSKPQGRKPETFHETLVQGDWKAARAESKKVADAAGNSVRMRGQLKIDVLSALTDEQRKLVIDKFPRLIYKPWRRAMREDPSR